MSSFSLNTKTDRLLLRPFQRSDVAAVARYHTLPSVQRYVVRPTRYPEEVAGAVDIMCGHTALQRPGDTISAAIVRQVEQDLIGQVSLHWPRQARAKFGSSSTLPAREMAISPKRFRLSSMSPSGISASIAFS
jgi:RimJ/RimL family protein N-acetyltransferase